MLYFQHRHEKPFTIFPFQSHKLLLTGYSEKWKSCCRKKTSVGEIKQDEG